MQLGVEHEAEVREGESLPDRLRRDADPGGVPLGDVHRPLAVIDDPVDAALEDRFEVVLHPRAGDPDDDPQREDAPFRQPPEIGAVHDDLPVVHLFRGGAADEFVGHGAPAAELDVRVGLPDPLPFEGGTEGDGDRHLDHLHLDAPRLHPRANHFVARGAREEQPGDFRHGLVGQDRQPRLHRAGGDREGDVVQGSEGAHERLHAVAEVGEHRGSLAAADSAEGEPRADGEVDGVDHRGERPQRERLEILPELHSLRVELRDHVPREEDEEPDLLELPDHRRRGRGVRRLPDHHGDPGNGAVHKVDPEFAQDRIGYEAHRRGHERVAVLVGDGADHVRGQERGRAGVEGVLQRRAGPDERPRQVEHLPGVGQGRNPDIGKTEDHGQFVGGIRVSERSVFAPAVRGGIEGHPGETDDGPGAAQAGGKQRFVHRAGSLRWLRHGGRTGNDCNAPARPSQRKIPGRSSSGFASGEGTTMLLQFRGLTAASGRSRRRREGGVRSSAAVQVHRTASHERSPALRGGAVRREVPGVSCISH